MGKLNNYLTKNTQIVHTAMTDAMLNRKMIGIIGQPGSGKSKSLAMMKSENANIYGIELGKSVTSKEMYRRILADITKTVGHFNISSAILMNKIKDSVEAIPGNKLVVIDEAGFFTKDKVSYLLELYNLISNHCGIVVMGPAYYEQNLKDWIDQGINGVEEFYSRFSYFNKLSNPQNDEIQFVLKGEGIDIKKEGQRLYSDILKIKRKNITWRYLEHLIDDYFMNNPKQKNDG